MLIVALLLSLSLAEVKARSDAKKALARDVRAQAQGAREATRQTHGCTDF